MDLEYELPAHKAQHTCGIEDPPLEPCLWEASTTHLAPLSTIPCKEI